MGVSGPAGQLLTVIRTCSHAPSATRIRAVALPPWIRGNRDEPTSTPAPYPTSNSGNDDGDNPTPDLSTFWGCLKRIRDGDGADGLLWPETTLPPGREQAMARVERAAVGMLTVAEMLHAAERCRLMATPDRHLDEGVVDGLFMACRGLAELVCREVCPE